MKKIRDIIPKSQKGVILVALLVIVATVTTVLFSVLVISSVNIRTSRLNFNLINAQYAAETGADEAIARLNAKRLNDSLPEYTGTDSDRTLLTNGSQYVVRYSATVSPGASEGQKIIRSTGKVYFPASAAEPTAIREVEVVAELKGQRAGASMMSTGIVQVSSNTTITGKDVLVNEYIELTHPNAKLQMDGLRIAGYKTNGGRQCSIGPRGQILNTTPTNSVVKLGYKNCAGTTQAGVDVTQDDSTVSKIGSLEIPWQVFMDSSYTDQGNCTALINGGNLNKGHYPDKGTGASGQVATNCGTNGTLLLSNKSYALSDNVHIRANLCQSNNPCSPTFINNSTEIKYVFVEGSINFYDVKVPSGSPIVFVSYNNGICCGGNNTGAVYFKGTAANSTTNAPLAYFLAPKGDVYVNAKVQSIGGVGGKNIYVSTTGGASHALPINPSFPFGDIPVDIAWYASRYRRVR